MKRSPQPVLKTFSSSSTTTTVAFSPTTLSIPSPYHHHNCLTRSPTRAGPPDIADDVDDDIFGSAAWKKKRAKRGGGKKTGSGRENDGKNDSLTHSKRWAFVRFVEQHARKVRGYACAVKKWCKDVCEGFQTLHDSEQPLSEGGRDSVAVPTAGGSSPATSENCELRSEALAEETKVLCGNYIYHRLTSKGLMTKRVPVTAHHSLIADELCTAGQELERLYPRVYSDVSRRISMTMTSAQLVRRALTSVLEEIFRSGVTWARLVAMVAIAAAFAEECVVQGHPTFVEDVLMCVDHFVTMQLSDWLIKHGGWASFPTSRPPAVLEDSVEVSGSPLLLMTAGVVMGAAIFLLLLLSRLLGDT